MTTSSVESLLLELLELTRSINQLDLEEEANYDLLLSLQDQQVKLRESISQIIESSNYIYSEADRDIMKECIELEHISRNRYLQFKTHASSKLELISGSRKSRGAYQGEYIQHTGYFIDKQN
ncbi:hypothetical protein [Paenibacillus sp. NPDC057967]|uniref:hypothetical protein n=1 Tax=Paenibacillus sp. NPDC057967 TaxID=3346293 RepID=UPI0036DE6228